MSDRAPFIAAAVAFGLVFLFVVAVLPESVPNAKLSDARTVSWIATMGQMLRMFDPCPTRARPNTAPWLILFFFYYSCETENGVLSALYTGLGNGTAVNMDASEFGLLSAVSSLCKWLYLWLVLPMLVRWLGPARAPPVAIRCSTLVAGIAIALTGAAPSPAVLFCLAAVQAVGMLTLPAMRAMLSLAHAPAEQGRVLGSIAIMETLATIVAPILGGQLWKATVEIHLAWLCFVVLGGTEGLVSFLTFVQTPLPAVREEEVVAVTAASVSGPLE